MNFFAYESAPRGALRFKALLKSIWPLLFTLLCATVCEYKTRQINYAKEELQGRLEELGREKEAALRVQEDLRLRVNSQGDPEWIEMTLMKTLGLVPEGQTKVIFR